MHSCSWNIFARVCRGHDPSDPGSTIDVILLQTLAEILYEAASDCRYVDPKKVEQILGMAQPDADPPIRRSIQPVTTDEGTYNQDS